ncbi:MAG: GGDEF domain-containing protein [Ruminococcus sp.]|nr:GGDEF domain-containing protein [Ruminococcus sp.]
MKSARKKKEKDNSSFVTALAMYLLIYLIGMALVIMVFNSLIKKHDKQLTGEICDLVTEKMNNSIRYMTLSAEDVSAVLSAQDIRSSESLYDPLKKCADRKPEILSMGLIDSSGSIYASESEKREFEKWDMLKLAKQADPISISPPYRFSKTGETVFTMFVDMTFPDGSDGYLFMTYPLAEIQNMAYSDSIGSKTDIWLMNAESDNIIQCAGSNSYLIGSWNNALLTFGDINDRDISRYDEWKSKMANGERSAAVVYGIDNVRYTQVFSKIDYMHGWYLVVRMPSSSLSKTMLGFRTTVLIFIIVMMAATTLLFVLVRKRSLRERAALESLSTHDPLTGALNRLAFDREAEEHLKSTQRKQGALLFIDVDHFKQVNDRYGHAAGDKVLKEFTNALNELFGEKAYIARYGGDEFTVFVKGLNKETVSIRIGQLSKMVSAIIPGEEKSPDDLKITFSCGGAFFPDDGIELKVLERSADTALYRVKENGRNGYAWNNEKVINHS